MHITLNRVGDEVRIGRNVRVVVIEAKEGMVRLGIDAPEAEQIVTPLVDTDAFTGNQLRNPIR